MHFDGVEVLFTYTAARGVSRKELDMKITMDDVMDRMYNDIHSGFYCQDCAFYEKTFSGSNEEPPEWECLAKSVSDCPYYIDKMEGEDLET